MICCATTFLKLEAEKWPIGIFVVEKETKSEENCSLEGWIDAL